MNTSEKQPRQTAFHSLTPEMIITLAEQKTGRKCTNLCRPLASYINRVYELELEDGNGVVAKFYRPGRWSKKSLQDEHDFLLELADQEIPVIPPLTGTDGASLGHFENIYFALYPKKGGRTLDEYNDEQWLELGRLIGRTHTVGAGNRAKHRMTLLPEKSTAQQVKHLLQGNFIPQDMYQQFQETTASIIDLTQALFADIEMIRIHGDCHFANLIYRPDESFYLIDFDDMVTGPPVQDFWMLLPGYTNDAIAEIELFLEGYETFREFDRRTLRLIEPLRAMRYIHYISWCAHQVAEDGSSHVAPDFGSQIYWQREIKDLQEQLERIREMKPIPEFLL